MKINEGFELREVCGEHVIVAHGVKNIDFSKIINLNESAVLMWKSVIGKDFSVEDIDRWHRQRGFNGIGYHFVIYRDGSIHAGRSKRQIGAHCKGHNTISIGICYIGGLSTNGKPKDTRTAAQKASLRALVEQLQEEFPLATVHGHNEFAAKACPCFDVQKEFGLKR